MNTTKCKTITARGYMTSLRYNGTSYIRTVYGTAELSRDETLLWSCTQYSVSDEATISSRYYRTAALQGFHVADIGKVFKSLYDKHVVTFGRDTNIADATYRMLCGCILAIAGDIGIQGENVAEYDRELHFPPVVLPEVLVPLEDFNKAMKIAHMIANDRWMLPQLVRNIDEGKPDNISRKDIFREYCSAAPQPMRTFVGWAWKESLLNDTYYQTDIGRQTAELISILISTRIVIIL